MTHGNAKGQCVKNETEANIKAQIAKLEQQVKYCQDKIRWYEEELEHREQEVPLGVPLEDVALATVVGAYKFGFASEDSRCVFSMRLNEYVKLLQKCAKDEPIDIAIILPLLRKGYVAMDKNGDWYWYSEKPKQGLVEWTTEKPAECLAMFNIKLADDWDTSLIECGI